MSAALLAQIQFRDRSQDNSCVANDGFCPDWIAKNIDKYWGALGEHVYLTVSPWWSASPSPSASPCWRTGGGG